MNQGQLNIEYREDLGGISSQQLQGFFVGWLNPPKPETHLEILKKAPTAVI